MAKQPMLKFVKIERDMPVKRPASDRKEDFREIYAEYADEKAKEQASRCSQCGVPYCQSHCPLHNNIPDWLRLTAEGRLQEAYGISQATNTFPEICGRICPQDRLCEGNCVIEQSGHGTVTIGAVEKYITDTAWDEGWVEDITPQADRPEKIAVIGAGPGGLAAADVLRRAGCQVTVYDRYDRAGGLLTYGIPGFKLEKDIVMRRVEQLKAGGVEFVMNCDVDAAIFAKIRSENDAIIIATGVYKSRDLELQGSEAGGIVKAIDYLTASNRVGFGDSVAEYDSGVLNASGKKVVVIGGGNTAVEEALYLTNHSDDVTLIHRRDELRAERILQERLLNHPKISVIWNKAVESFEAGENGALHHLNMRDTVTGEDSQLEVDGAFVAIGHAPATELFKGKLPMDDGGYLLTEAGSPKTEVPGVFAAGDVTDHVYRQAVTAAGMGCMAALDAERFLANIEIDADGHVHEAEAAE